MNKQKNDSGTVARRLAPFLFVACVSSVDAADFYFNPDLTLSAIYTDNLLLAPDGFEESETVGEVRPGLRMGVYGQRIEARLDYLMQNYFFSDSTRDTTYHELDATLESEPLAEWLFLDATGRISQSIIDPTQLVPYNDFVSTDNRVDYMAVEANPYLLHDFGNFVRVRLGYSYGILRYDDFDEAANPNVQDFDDTVLNFVATSLPEDTTLSWELRYNNERVEYDVENNARVEYEVYGGELAWRVKPGLQLFGRVGRETDLRVSQQTSLVESDIWAAGLRMQSSQGNTFEASFGERFFGETYAASWSYEGSKLVAGFDYSESPLAVGQQLFQLPVLGQPLPGDVGAPLTAITPEFYISELASGWIALNGRRNTLMVTVYRDRREFLGTEQNEAEEGVLFDWDWRLGPRTTLFMELTWQHVDYRASERDDEFTVASLGAERQLGEATLVRLELRHGGRTTDSLPESRLFEESGAVLEFTHRFGKPPPDETEPLRSRADRERRGESVLRDR